MTEQMKDSLLTRIKKLMAMTVERGATVEEAATAARKIQQILFEHNLSMSQVESHNPDQPKEGMGKTEYTMKFGGPMAARWMATLTHYIAKYNFGYVVTNTRERKIWVIGKPSNVEVILYMAEYIGLEIQRLCKERMKGPNNNSSFYNAFTRGAVDTIRQRLYEQQEVSKAQSTTGTALVVASEAQLKQAVAQYFPRLRAGRSARSLRDGGAYRQGQEAGRGISITRGIGAKKSSGKFIG